MRIDEGERLKQMQRLLLNEIKIFFID